MRSWLVLIIICFATAALPSSALAQSPLAEAAKKAEEQRQQNAGRSQVFTDRDLKPKNAADPELLAAKLTFDRIERYSNAHVEIMRALLADRELDTRVAQQRVEDFSDYERLLNGEPAFAERLANAGITAHEYVYTEGAIVLVRELIKQGAQPSQVSAPAVSENLRLVRAEPSLIGKMLTEGSALEEAVLARRTLKEPAKN